MKTISLKSNQILRFIRRLFRLEDFLKGKFMFVALLTVFSLNAQDRAERKVIPPSPDAAALGKYGEIPVDLCNGLAKVQIPLYTIKSRSLELPISLSYHASGNKVDEVASWVGLGWVLNAGGVVTRSIRGKADEDGDFLSATFMSSDNIYSSSNSLDIFNYLHPRAFNNHDGESDMYYYNANGIGGSFVYNTNHQLVQIPLTDDKITGTPGSDYTIVSENGTKYIFDVIERTAIDAGSAHPTSFYLSKMISPDKADTIFFEYVTDTYQYRDMGVSSRIERYDWGGLVSYTPISLTYFQYSDTKILSKIRFANGYVDFIKSGDRTDRRKYRLSAIRIYNKADELQQSIKLEHDHYQSYAASPSTNYEDNIAYRLRLHTVKMVDKNDTDISTYSLAYDTTYKLPYYYGGPFGYAYFGQDKWGYFNGETSNNNFLENSSTPANRNISTAHAKAGILSSITYPTGGKSIFYYGANTAGGATTAGVRIEKIETYEKDGASPLIKEFSYSDGYAGGNPSFLNAFNNYNYSQGYAQGNHFYPTGYIVNNVTVSNPILGLSTNSNISFYETVTEKQLSGSVSLGKTEYQYERDDDEIYYTGTSFVFGGGGFFTPRYSQYPVNLSWSRGPLKETRIYKTEGGVFSLIKSIANTYHKINSTTVTTGINVFGSYRYEDDGTGFYPSNPGSWTSSDMRDLYQFFDIQVKTWSKKTASTTEKSYVNGTELSNVITYSYGSTGTSYPHYQLTSKQSTGSKGETITESYRYTGDDASISTTAYNMYQQNIKSSLLSQVTTVGSTDISGTKTFYNQYTSAGGATMYLPQKIQLLRKSAGFTDYIYFDNYDGWANLLESRKANDISTAYIWDYNTTLPIAQANNAVFASIAATGFEHAGTGNWDYSSAGITTSYQGITGKKAFALSSSNIQRTGLVSGTSYVISYWKNDAAGGSVSLGGTALMSKNGWTLYQTTVTGITSITISGSAVIDELRLYPQNAQMTTYTYEPLVGMTSECDINNRITYYEYDAFGRLLRIRDMDKNILKTFEYKYKEAQ
jgi:YD repeat-containing protein